MTPEDLLWAAFEKADNCCADRELDVIDTGGHFESFRMSQVADALRELLTVRSVEELDSLPLFSVIRYRYMSAAGWDLHQLWKRIEGGWFCISSPLNPPNQSFGTPQLPALVLYRPDWDTP